MDALQAAVLGVKLGHLPRYLELRTQHAHGYAQRLAGIPELATPPVRDGSEPSHSVYTLRVKGGRRDALASELRAAWIDTAVHYPVPLHRQPALLERGLGLEAAALPVVERAADEVLALPIYPELSAGDRERVCGEIRRFASARRGS